MKNKKPRLKIEPDAWCAWNPDVGYMLATIAYDPTHAEGILCDQIEVAGIENPGEWILKPVYFSTEPPVPKEVLELMVRYIKYLGDTSGKLSPLNEDELRQVVDYVWSQSRDLPEQPKGDSGNS